MYLLQSHDVEVQRAASAALGNLAVNSEENQHDRTLEKTLIVSIISHSREQAPYSATKRS